MGRITAKANLYVITDVEGRRLGERIGLDTLVVQADNYECYILAQDNISISCKLIYHLKYK